MQTKAVKEGEIMLEAGGRRQRGLCPCSSGKRVKKEGTEARREL